MQKKTGWIAAGAVVLATVGGASGIAFAGGGDKGTGNDDGAPISGAAYDRATAVALDAAGGGKVTQTEQGDEESYYQVEVTKPDGSQVDVNLDKSFTVVKTKAEAADSKDDGKDKKDEPAGGDGDGETNDDAGSGANQG
jgi:hypothetical protein